MLTARLALVALLGLAAACDDGTEMLGEPGTVVAQLPVRLRPRPASCGQFGIRRATGFRAQMRLLEPELFEARDSFLHSSWRLAALPGARECRLHLNNFDDGP
jgi:hypothetical protein